MHDIPTEIHVALEAAKLIAAAGRCREDADLYGSSCALVNQYLVAQLAGRPAEPLLPKDAPIAGAPFWGGNPSVAPAMPSTAPPAQPLSANGWVMREVVWEGGKRVKVWIRQEDVDPRAK